MSETRAQLIERIDNYWLNMKSEEVLRDERVKAARENRETFGSLISDDSD